MRRTCFTYDTMNEIFTHSHHKTLFFVINVTFVMQKEKQSIGRPSKRFTNVRHEKVERSKSSIRVSNMNNNFLSKFQVLFDARKGNEYAITGHEKFV